MNTDVRLTRRCTRPRYRAQIGGSTRFVVGFAAGALSPAARQVMRRPLAVRFKFQFRAFVS